MCPAPDRTAGLGPSVGRPMKTPTTRHASVVTGLAFVGLATLLTACTQPAGGASGEPSGAPDPAVSAPGTVEPAVDSSAAPDDEYEYSAP